MAEEDYDEDKYKLTEEDDEFIEQLEKIYEFDSIIGRGGFGMVFKAIHKESGKDVAIKAQRTHAPKKVRGKTKILPLKNRLNIEKDIIIALRKQTENEKYVGKKFAIPDIIEVGTTEHHHYMVITLLGPSLKTVLREMKYLSQNTAFQIGTQIINTLELMHDAGFVHRDLKLQNILIGLGGDRNFYLVDFGLAQKHAAEFSDGYNIVGTTKYVSINVHRGYEYSWCDDLESLGYVLLRLILGNLPWTDDMSDEEIMSMKENLVLKGPLYEYMLYIDDLAFGEKPDYDYLRSCLKNDAKKEYDWE
jgi:casein kinase 1